MTVYVCVWVSGCLCECVVEGVGVVCWRVGVGVWVSGCRCFIKKKNVSCVFVCVFFFFFDIF